MAENIALAGGAHRPRRPDRDITLDIVLRLATSTGRGKGFQVQPRRWIFERTFAWISRRRRCGRDYERRTDHHETMIHWATILQMTRRRARLP